MNDELLKALANQSKCNTEYRQAVADDVEEQTISDLFEKTKEADGEVQKVISKIQSAEREVDSPSEVERELVPDIKLSEYIKSAVEGKQVQGAEKELVEERSLASVDGVIPFEALLPRGQTEDRADAATAVSNTTIAKNAMGILPRVFNKTVANHLGILMPVVPRGDAVYPVLTSGDDGSIKARGVSHDAVAAVFTGHTIQPKRITARYKIAVEDVARLEGLEDVLREDLTMALGVVLDSQIINGDASGANFLGIVKALGNGIKTDAKTSTFGDYQKLVSGGVDGKYASMMSEVRVAMSPDAFNHALSVERSASALENSYEYLQRVTMNGVAVSKQIPSLTALRTSRGSDGVAPMWEGIQLVRDAFTDASSGEINLTAIMLAGFSLLRHDTFHGNKFKSE